VRKLLVALGATFGVLLVTGLYQAFRYRPVGALGFWNDATELVHRIGAYVFAALVVAVVVAWILGPRDTGRSRFIAVVVLVVLALATLAAIVTGGDIRWDQLALSRLSVGSGPRGVFLPDGVKFVLLGTDALSPSEFSSRVFLHLVVFPVGLLVCGGVLWFLSVRGDRRRHTADAAEAVP
jgi:quinol-cytochrome oxidoreductase complex cytochrome b subunit